MVRWLEAEAAARWLESRPVVVKMEVVAGQL
jgi:hypothetical protein